MASVKGVKKRALSSLKPYERNARTHSDEQIEQIARSIKEFGFINPVLIDEDGTIIAGHGRVMAAGRVGMTEVPVLYVEDLTDEQKKAYVLVDNKLTELGGWDFELLDSEILDLDGVIDMTDFGFSTINTEELEFNVEDFFERGVEAKEKPPVLGCKVVCGTEEELERCLTVLREAGYNPEIL